MRRGSSSRGRERNEHANIDYHMAPADDHEWIQFNVPDVPWSIKNKWFSNLTSLRDKSIEPGRTIDWSVLERFGIADRVREIVVQRYTCNDECIDDTVWLKLFNIREYSYRVLCCEFFATYEFHEDYDRVTDDGTITFRLGGEFRSMSLIEFGIALGLYDRDLIFYEDEIDEEFEEYLRHGQTVAPSDFDYDAAWARLGVDEWWAGHRVERQIVDPVHRVIHRMFALAVVTRKSGAEKMNLTDLWILSTMTTQGRYMNVPFLVAQFLSSGAGEKDKSPICGGQYVTRIAKYLGISLAGLQREDKMGYIDKYLLGRMNVIVRNAAGQEFVAEADVAEEDVVPPPPQVPPPTLHSLQTDIHGMQHQIRGLEYQMAVLGYDAGFQRHATLTHMRAQMRPEDIPVYYPPPQYGFSGYTRPPPPYDPAIVYDPTFWQQYQQQDDGDQ